MQSGHTNRFFSIVNDKVEEGAMKDQYQLIKNIIDGRSSMNDVKEINYGIIGEIANGDVIIIRELFNINMQNATQKVKILYNPSPKKIYVDTGISSADGVTFERTARLMKNIETV